MTSKTLNRLRATTLEALRPVARRPLSEYIESVVCLPSGLSAVPGAIRLWGFQAGLADALIDPEFERVSIIKGARLGFSTILVAAIGHYIRNDPTSVLCVVPTDDDSRNLIVSQIEPTFAASPELRDAIPITRTGPHGNFDTMKYRRFPGGSLRVVSARSPRNLRSHSARVLIVDEADACEITVEGNPIMLAEKRTLSFDNRKIIIGSTPTNTTTSIVHNSYLNSDQRIYECPCPSCGEHHEIRWADIRWPEGKPEEAAWCCPSCGVFHGEEHKPGMVARGRWRATAPHVKGHAGFRLSCLIAPHGPAAWPKLAAEFLIAKRRPETLRTFVNTVLGEPWNDDDNDGPQPHELQVLAQPISLADIPREVLYLTAGVDVQIDRLEIGTIGFTADDEWLFLDHRLLYGDPQKDDVWRDLDELLAERYPHPAGGTIGRDATCIDAGDGNAMARVMAFCAGRRHLRAIPVKGASGSRPALVHAASKRARNLHICGVDGLKTRLFDRLARREGVRFSDSLPGAWYEQLLSERPVVRYSRGQPMRVFERYPGRLAEALDCTIYGLAARTLIATGAGRREAELRGVTLPAIMPTVIRSAWLEGAR
jgi:phage terminase large subunit GpA-like protein